MVLLLVSACALSITACFTLGEQTPTRSPIGGGSLSASAIPTRPLVLLRELRLFIEPRDCASFILDPQPVEGSRYVQGTAVTISLDPAEGCRVKEWINIDSFSGLAGKVNMNGDRVVQVNLERIAATPLPVAIVTPLPTASTLQSVVTHELEIISDPREAATFVLNPNPGAQGEYARGTAVTIDVLPKAGWRIEEWIGPAYAMAGRSAKVYMDASQTVVVRLVEESETLDPDPTPTLPPSVTPTPTARPTAAPRTRATPRPTPTPQPTPRPTATPPPGGERVLFQDDFGIGFATKWQSLSIGFTVVQDDAGNYVLQGSNDENSTFDIGANVGDSTWRDYALEFRARVLKASREWDLTARVRSMPRCDRYTLWFEAGNVSGAQLRHQQTGGTGCQTVWRLVANTPRLELNRWYSVRIEVLGPRITAYLDGRQIFNVKDDDPLLTGGIKLTIKPGATIQYDDVKVINLAVPPRPTPTPPPTPTPAPTPIPTPTLRPLVIPTAASYSSLGSDAAAARAFAEPFLRAVNTLPPDFLDDFVSKDKGWRWDRGIDVLGTPDIQDGVMRMSDLVGYIGASTDALGSVGDFVLQVDMRMVQGDQSAKHLVYLRKGGRYEYLLEVNSVGGSWRVRKISPEGGTFIAAGAGGVSPLGQVTRMLAVFSGDQAIIYLNGRPIFYMNDEHLDSRSKTQLRCTSKSESVCEFDNVRYWDLANLPK